MKRTCQKVSGDGSCVMLLLVTIIHAFVYRISHGLHIGGEKSVSYIVSPVSRLFDLAVKR